ncbi:hypothetical protein, partial [Brevibacillus sp. MS2.2]|uniref:hypothetical protein n=1 Tax=Brevibacillus sp. MS2.2 TaxID=2738981 RepID=UPI001C2C7391
MQRKSWIVVVTLLLIIQNFFGFTTTSYAQTQGEVVIETSGEPGTGDPTDPGTGTPTDPGTGN